MNAWSKSRADWTLCIDFGTAFSKAAAAPADAWAHFDPRLVRPLMMDEEGASNPFLLESAVIVEDERLFFGAEAVDRASRLQKRQALRSFKTLLSAPDLERALNTAAPFSVDPHRVFTLGDLIVLYLAYLTYAIECAIAADPVLQGRSENMQRRYATPAWREGREGAAAHATIARLFAEADDVREALGADAFGPDGCTVSAARQAVAAARSVNVDSTPDMGMIFEATAAAVYTSIGLETDASHFIVVDMGAGTTDIAALVRGRDGHLMELSEARVTLNQAGDFVDRILLNLALDASPGLRKPADQAHLWRSMLRHIRDLKEALFHDERASFRHEGRTITLDLKAMARDKDFKVFFQDLARGYEHALNVVRTRALRDFKEQEDRHCRRRRWRWRGGAVHSRSRAPEARRKGASAHIAGDAGLGQLARVLWQSRARVSATGHRHRRGARSGRDAVSSQEWRSACAR